MFAPVLGPSDPNPPPIQKSQGANCFPDKPATIGGYRSKGEAIASGVKNVAAVTSLVITPVEDARCTENTLNTSDAIVTSNTPSNTGVLTKPTNNLITETDMCYTNLPAAEYESLK